ncbi:MAG: hypothetical protein ACLQPN_17610 [Bryobacteraceae bacterium]
MKLAPEAATGEAWIIVRTLGESGWTQLAHNALSGLSWKATGFHSMKAGR